MRYPWDVFQKVHQNFIPTIPTTKIWHWFLDPKKPLKTLYHDRLQQTNKHLESVHRWGHTDPCNSACRSFWTCTPKSSQRESQTSIMDEAVFFWRMVYHKNLIKKSDFIMEHPNRQLKPWIELPGKKSSWKFKGKIRRLQTAGNKIMVATWWQQSCFPRNRQTTPCLMMAPLRGAEKNDLQQTRNKASRSYWLQLFLQS